MPPGNGQTIDYDALAQQHGSIDYDSIAKQHGSLEYSDPSDPQSPWHYMNPQDIQTQISQSPFRSLQIPFEQLSNTAQRAQSNLQNKMLSNAAKGQQPSTWDMTKNFLYGSGSDTSRMTAGAVSPAGIGTAVATAVAPEVMGPLLLAHGTVGAAENVPGAIQGNPNAVQGMLQSGAEAAGGGAVAAGSIGPGTTTPIRDVWNANKVSLQRLSGAMQTPQQATQVPAGSSFSPARQVSNQDVINWGKLEGIDFTPAQETGNKGAKFVQGIGEQTMTPGGQPLQDALELNRGKVEQAIENLAFRYDPHALGSTPESAGTALQSGTKTALQAAKTSSDLAYKQAGLDSQGITISDLRNRLAAFVDDIRNPNNPEYQTPAVESALKDIESKISDPRLGPQATVQSARNLRTEFWEKANDYSGTIPDAAKRIYAMASQVPDDAMMAAGKGTKFEQSFRDASQQWADLKSQFDTPGEPLTKLLQSSDPKQAYNSIVNGKSADTISKLQNAGIDVGPIRSQVIRDIAGKSFRASGNTLAGYPDSFLQQLLGPSGTQELYTAAETARRLNVEANASGSGRLLIAKDQLGWNPSSWVRGEAAARASMPKPAGSTVGQSIPVLPMYQSLTPKMISLRALAGAGGASESAEEGR